MDWLLFRRAGLSLITLIGGVDPFRYGTGLELLLSCYIDYELPEFITYIIRWYNIIIGHYICKQYHNFLNKINWIELSEVIFHVNKYSTFWDIFVLIHIHLEFSEILMWDGDVPEQSNI